MIQHNSFSQYINALVNGPRSNRGMAALLLFVLCPFSLTIIRALLVRIKLGFAVDFIIGFIWVICIFISLPALKHKVRFIDVVIMIIISAFYVISGYLYPQNKVFLDANFDTFFMSCLPLYFLGLSLDYDKHRNSLYWVSVVSILINILFVYFISNGLAQGELSDDNMSWSYTLLISVVLILLYTFENSDVPGIIFSTIGVFLLLSLGTRGPVLCLVVFVAGYFLFFRTFKRNIIWKALIVAAGSLIYVFIDSICLFLIAISSSLGLSTRVFESVLTDTFANYQESNGRNEIYEILLDYVEKDETGFGYGLMGDRLLIPNETYSHNLEVEVLISFGKIGGIVILLLLLCFIINSFRKTKGTESALVLFVLFCCSIIQLQFSNSFLMCPVLFLFFGFAVAATRLSPKNKKSAHVF